MNHAPTEQDRAPRHTPRATARGSLTEGPILKTLIGFSIPMLIGNVVQTLNGSINAMWVGRLLGEKALAATTNANGVMFLMISLVFGLGNATTVRIGQHCGGGEIDAARRTFGSGVGFCVALSALIGLAGWITAPGLLHMLATPSASFAMAITYLRVIFIAIPLNTASMMLGMGLRGAGDSKSPMYSMLLTVTVDLVLNPLLIRGWGPIPAFGIGGSAFASVVAGLAGVLLLLVNMYRLKLPLRLRGKEIAYLVPRSAELSYILRKGVPMGGQMLLMSSAQMVIVGLVNREGLNATAAYGASMQLWNYLQMPAFAISTAVSAMVAQNIGAGNHDRVSQVTRTGMLCNLVMTGTLAALIVAAAGPLLAIFLGADSPALPIARHIQYVCTWTWLVMGAGMVATGTMRAYGAVIAPLVIQMIALYPVRLGFYFLAYPRLGGEALWWCFPVASMVSAGLTILAYTRGNWGQRHERLRQHA